MLNNVSIVGRLVRDPEVRRTAEGTAVCSFAIACDRNMVSKNGERLTDFIDVVAWRSTAEFVEKYFAKGNWISVSGRLQSRTYEDKEGKKRKVVEVQASEVGFCGGKQIAEKKSPEGDYELMEGEDDDLPF